MPQQIDFGTTQPSIESPEAPKRTAYTIMETIYYPDDARNTEELDPYSVRVRNQDEALAVATLDHRTVKEGYLGSERDGPAVFSSYKDGSRRAVIVTKGDFVNGGLESKLN